ncbi:hypothetical protein B7486_78120, partial [cyanobacterium TDX16]
MQGGRRLAPGPQTGERTEGGTERHHLHGHGGHDGAGTLPGVAEQGFADARRQHQHEQPRQEPEEGEGEGRGGREARQAARLGRLGAHEDGREREAHREQQGLDRSEEHLCATECADLGQAGPRSECQQDHLAR